jgi:hypothetical protein
VDLLCIFALDLVLEVNDVHAISIFQFGLLDFFEIVLILFWRLPGLHDLIYAGILLEFVFGSKFADQEMEFLQVAFAFIHILPAMVCVIFMDINTFYELLELLLLFFVSPGSEVMLHVLSVIYLLLQQCCLLLHIISFGLFSGD